MNIKECILSKQDAKLEPVVVPEWETTVYIRSFSGKTRDNIDRWITSRIGEDGNIKDPSGLKVFVLINSLCDENGNLIFEEKDIPSLQEKNHEVIKRLFEVASRLNGLGMSESENIQDAKKNSP